MNYGEDAGAGVEFETMRGRDWPSVRQFNLFLENRVGAMLDVVRRFESARVRIVSLTVVDSADCAIIRMVYSDPERATEILQHARIPYTESDLLVVKMPDSEQPLLAICKSLLASEINIHYAYPLLIGVGPMGHTAIAFHVEDHENAVQNLLREGFVIFTDSDLID